MSYEIALATLLEQRDKALHGRFLEIKNRTRSLLSYTQAKFPSYTPHDAAHSETVEEILNELMPDSFKESMNKHEIFFLVVSALLHDWGMIGSADQDSKEVRELHHVRTAEFIEQFHENICLNHHEARIVGLITKGHRKVNLFDHEYNTYKFGIGNDIRLRLLSALLRIADECDIAHNRTPIVIFNTIKPTGISEQEFTRHYNVAGIGVGHGNHKIEITAVASDPKAAAILRQMERKIQGELDSIKSILAADGIPLEYVELQLHTRGFIDKPISFDVCKNRIVELLIGPHLYKRRDVAIRELIQNSIDSCKMRKNFEANYNGKVLVYFETENILVVEDNGLGMSFSEAKAFLSEVGTSYYGSGKYAEKLKGEKFSPISKFGIGILSCFLIGSSLCIETMQAGSDPCRFVIDSVHNDWTYSRGSLLHPGTKVCITTNNPTAYSNLETSLKHYFVCPDVDIQYEVSSGQFKTLRNFWDINAAFERLVKRTDASLDRSCAVFSKVESDKYDCICAKLPRDYYIARRCVIYNHGIYVADNDIPQIIDGVACAINIKTDIVDFEISRDSIVRNEKFYNFLELVYIDLINAVARQRDFENQADMFNKYKAFASALKITDGIKNEVASLTPSSAAFFSVAPVMLFRDGTSEITTISSLSKTDQYYLIGIVSEAVKSETITALSLGCCAVSIPYVLGPMFGSTESQICDFLSHHFHINIKPLFSEDVALGNSDVLEVNPVCPALNVIRFVRYTSQFAPLCTLVRQGIAFTKFEVSPENIADFVGDAGHAWYTQLRDHSNNTTLSDADDTESALYVFETLPLYYVNAEDPFFSMIIEHITHSHVTNEFAQLLTLYIIEFLEFDSFADDSTVRRLLDYRELLESTIAGMIGKPYSAQWIRSARVNSDFTWLHCKHNGPFEFKKL